MYGFFLTVRCLWTWNSKSAHQPASCSSPVCFCYACCLYWATLCKHNGTGIIASAAGMAPCLHRQVRKCKFQIALILWLRVDL